MHRVTRHRLLLAIAGVVGAMALAGCGRDAAPTGRPAAKPAAEPAAADDLVAGVGATNPDAVAEIRFGLPAAPTVGEPFRVTVAVVPKVALPSVRVEIRGTGGLAVLEPASPVTLETLGAGTTQRVEVTARASAPGTQVVEVTLQAEQPSGSDPVRASFPVVVTGPVGAGAGGPSPAAAPAATGG